MNHFIRKQIIDITIQHGVDALSLQDRIKDRFWIDLLPVIEAEFDKVATEGVDYIIDQIQIDLGNISEEMIESGEWAGLLKRKLSEKLREIISESSLKSGWRVEKSYLNVFNQWFYFLEHGYLPWNVLRSTEQWYDQVLEALGREYSCADRLRKLIVENKSMTQRIVSNHNENFLLHLVELLTAEKQSELPELVHELSGWLHTIISGTSAAIKRKERDTKSQIWHHILLAAALTNDRRTPKELISVLITDWFSLSNTGLKQILAFYPVEGAYIKLETILINLVAKDQTQKHVSLEEEPQEQPNDIGNITDEDISAKVTGTSKSHEKLLNESLNEEQISQRFLEQFAKPVTEKESDRQWLPDEMLEDGIYIHHAGIVLLHPFLHSFFRKLELVKEGQFIDEQSQQRAICLMHELTGTGDRAMEFDLVLPKLLCHWPLQRPVNIETEFTEEENREINNMLQALISQWEILKNTSSAGLQETFLQRNGKLFQRSSQWWLKVESNPVDVLLDHLPWTISMIKLPWMKELLRVEWR